MLPLVVDGFRKGDYVRIECVMDDGKILIVYGTVKATKAKRIILEDWDRIEVESDVITDIKVIERAR